ncbi:MAG: ABC transporter permease [Opitutaceae bacterium]|jgi:putative ABC transport system permease protein
MIAIFQRWLARLRAIFTKPALDADFDQELAQHLEAATADNIRAGMTPDEARRQARIALGGIEQTRELHRETRGLPGLEDLWRDIRFATRSLRRSPGFSIATIVILALGIGGVTAMFSTLYTVLIRPLPYPQANRLVLGRATYSGDINPMVAGPDYVDYHDQSHAFSALEAYFVFPMEVTVVADQGAERARSLIVSAGLFQTLVVNMALGRHFTAEEGRDNGPPVAIVSHDFWQKHFSGETNVAGRSLTIDGSAYDIVGVMPRDFQFIHNVDVWFPLRPQNLGPRRYNNWLILGRLQDGVSLAAAQSEVDIIAARLEKAYPDTNARKGLLLTPLLSGFTEQYRSGFGLLCGGTAAILLIACANAAGLLLARGAARRGELAVRVAIGASHWRLVRLLLAEALILAGAAGVLGVILAVWLQRGLLHLMPVEALFLRDVGISHSMLLVAFAATLITGFGFGLLPAWRVRQVDPTRDLKSGASGSGRQGVRLRGGLVVGQVAVSFVLLVIAGLFVRSITGLNRVDPGFNPRNLLTAEVPLPPGDYPDPKRVVFFSTLLDGVKALPGVESAALVSQVPLRDPYNNVGIYAADAPPVKPSDGGDGYQRVVLPGYFRAMGIPLLAGRDIQPTDSAESRRVVVISQQLAKSLFPDHDPLGRRVVIDRATDEIWEVVGVVADVKQDNLRQEASSRGTFYRAHAQQAWSTMRLAIRTAGNPQAIVPSLRATLQKMDSRIPLSGPRTMADVMANATVSEKAQALFLITFSLLALTLAAAGIYGLLAFSVSRRRYEIGIRLALGATGSVIARGIMREAGWLALAGVVAGSLGALGATQLVRANLYGVGSTDPLTFGIAAVVLLLVAALAAWLPARRAARVDPVEALRTD